MKAALAAILLLLPSVSPAEDLDGIGTGKPLVIEDSVGGSVDRFELKALELMAEGTPVIVDGPCLSACTILVDVDRVNVCITTNAILGYHKALYPDTGKTAPINYETPGLNAYLESRGGLPDPSSANLLLMGFEQAKNFYRPCSGAK